VIQNFSIRTSFVKWQPDIRAIGESLFRKQSYVTSRRFATAAHDKHADRLSDASNRPCSAEQFVVDAKESRPDHACVIDAGPRHVSPPQTQEASLVSPVRNEQ